MYAVKKEAQTTIIGQSGKGGKADQANGGESRPAARPETDLPKKKNVGRVAPGEKVNRLEPSDTPRVGYSSITRKWPNKETLSSTSNGGAVPSKRPPKKCVPPARAAGDTVSSSTGNHQKRNPQKTKEKTKKRSP